MKKLIIIIVCILLSVCLVSARQNVVTNVEQYQIKDTGEDVEEVAKYLKERQAELEKQKKMREPESSFRRFEVVFLSAGAIVYWSSYLFVRLYAEFQIERSTELPDSYWYFIITNSVGMATYIAVKDYYDVKRIQEIDRNKYGKKKNNYYKLSLLKARF